MVAMLSFYRDIIGCDGAELCNRGMIGCDRMIE
jgi:hypothetical protein